MRVISKDEQERIKQCSCCNSMIAYKMEDVRFDNVLNTKEIVCPVCNKWIKASIFDKKVKQ